MSRKDEEYLPYKPKGSGRTLCLPFTYCNENDLHVMFFQLIPMPVLYGVFLYMGITSLGGVQVSFGFVLCMLTLTVKSNLVLFAYSYHAIAFYDLLEVLPKCPTMQQ